MNRINVHFCKLFSVFLSGIFLLSVGCGTSVDQPTSSSAPATVTVRVSGSKDIIVGKPLAKLIPDNVASVVLNVVDAGTSVVAYTETVNERTGQDPIIFSFALPGGATYNFTARAYSQANGAGVLLYDGTISGRFVNFGEAVTVDINLVLAGTLPPTVTTNPATGVTNASATMDGRVNPNGFMTVAWFEWGTDYSSKTPIQQIGESNADVTVTQPIGGLSPDTLYDFRLVASNSGNLVYGGDQQFTTLPDTGQTGVNVFFPDIPLPTVTTDAASNILATSAQLNGTVNPQGTDTKIYFEWGETESYGHTTLLQNAGSASTGSSMQAVLTGLTAGTVYNYRIVAYNAGGLSVGLNRVFTTQ